jgi:D-aminopeptidase
MTDANGARPRARDIGIDIGIFRPGRWNAITDAPGVMVGHVTLVEGEGRLVPGRGPVRTGVTVILPHSGNLFGEKVRAAAYVLNGFGKSIGLHQVNELGNLETPIVLTNTLNAPIVADAVIEWSIKHSPEIGIGTGTINPVVGEVNDGILNDIQGRHVRKKHVFEAIANARSGAVQEGSVGAGTGSVCMGWKGGIGTSSRVLPPKRGGYTVGVLVQTNFGGVLTVNGAPVGRELGRYSNSADFPYETPEARDTEGADPEIGVPGISNPDGSVMVIVATDAPLDQRQLERLAKRAGLGLARTGFYSSNGSGDFFIAFSTAGRIPHDSPLTAKAEVMSNDAMSPLFLAVVEATEEAVINSMIKATTVVGRDGTMVDAIDIDQLLEVMRKYNALNWSRTLPPWGGGE